MSKRAMSRVVCAVCKKKFWRADAWLKRAALPSCSKQCNGQLRGKEWAAHAHKGRAAWSPASNRALIKRMTGKTNPAWKGGVTYFKTHGNYKGVKYVRCPKAYRPMARKDGYIMEHRLFVAQAIGRLLKRSEVVHHDDHNPANNLLSNLALFASNSDHKLFEAHGSPLPVWRG